MRRWARARRGSIVGGSVGVVGVEIVMGGGSMIGSIGGRVVLKGRLVLVEDVVSVGGLVPLLCRIAVGDALFPSRPLLRACVGPFLGPVSLLRAALEFGVLLVRRGHLAVVVFVELVSVFVGW